jgi:hypothetical protein
MKKGIFAATLLLVASAGNARTLTESFIQDIHIPASGNLYVTIDEGLQNDAPPACHTHVDRRLYIIDNAEQETTAGENKKQLLLNAASSGAMVDVVGDTSCTNGVQRINSVRVYGDH